MNWRKTLEAVIVVAGFGIAYSPIMVRWFSDSTGQVRHQTIPPRAIRISEVNNIDSLLPVRISRLLDSGDCKNLVDKVANEIKDSLIIAQNEYISVSAWIICADSNAHHGPVVAELTSADPIKKHKCIEPAAGEFAATYSTDRTVLTLKIDTLSPYEPAGVIIVSLGNSEKKLSVDFKHGTGRDIIAMSSTEFSLYQHIVLAACLTIGALAVYCSFRTRKWLKSLLEWINSYGAKK
jgi:hypothetical protein